MKHHEVYQNGEDNGWLHKQNWWFDPNHEHAFTIGDLDSLYPEKYFEVDHVKPDTIEAYCRLVTDFYRRINDKDISNLIEFGSAGGWFLKRFMDIGVDAIGIEGTAAGVQACLSRGIPRKNIQMADLRRSDRNVIASGKWQMALCTEVAEHIEPPFSAILVRDLCHMSDLIWFSFEEPNTNAAHVHHCNEMPEEFWINLFEFYGYGCYMLPGWVFGQTEGRGRMIFYNKEVYENNPFFNGVS